MVGRNAKQEHGERGRNEGFQSNDLHAAEVHVIITAPRNFVKSAGKGGAGYITMNY